MFDVILVQAFSILASCQGNAGAVALCTASVHDKFRTRRYVDRGVEEAKEMAEEE